MGTELEAEGLQGFRVTSVLAGGSTLVNSLEGLNVPMLVNGALAYVSATGDVYRWNSASTLAAVGTVVVLPNGQAPATPGRWILETPGNSVESLAVTDTGVQQNWVPGGNASDWDRARVLLLETGGGGDLTLGGLAAPLTPQSPRTKYILKTSADDNVIISVSDGGSAVANQLVVATGATTAGEIHEGWTAVYTNMWRLLGGVGVA